MNILVVCVTVVVVLPTAISSLQCYFSETRITLDYCFVRNDTADSLNSVNCDPNRYTCGIVQYTNRIGVRHFLRGCVDNENCWLTEPDKPCKDNPEGGKTNCNYYCCPGENNNKGLRCSTCQSSESDADCFKNMKNEECQLDQEYRCGRTSYRFQGEKVFHRGCMPVKHCNAEVYCSTSEAKTDCVTECCQGDLCNSKPSSTYGKKCLIDRGYYGALSTSATFKAMSNVFILSNAIVISLLNI